MAQPEIGGAQEGIPRMLYGHDGTKWIALLVDSQGRPQMVLVQHSYLQDADGDTKVQTEESPDEDMVRMDVAGVEAFVLQDDGIMDLAKQSRCRATNTATQAIPSGVDTKIVLNSEIFDEQDEFDHVTNYRFTAKRDGYYHVDGRFRFQADAGAVHHIALYRNGAAFLRVYGSPGADTTQNTLVMSETFYLTAGQYLEWYARHDIGANRNIYEAEANLSVSVHKLS